MLTVVRDIAGMCAFALFALGIRVLALGWSGSNSEWTHIVSAVNPDWAVTVMDWYASRTGLSNPADFSSTFSLMVALAWLMSLLWYIVCALTLRRELSWKRLSSYRAIWFVLMFVAACIIVAGPAVVFDTQSTATGLYIVSASLILIVVYWLPTALFSPTGAKYQPIGSIWLRRFW